MQTSAVNNHLPGNSEQLRIQKVARDFESIFTSMMLKAMRKTVGENELMPQSFGEKLYTGMLDDEYSRQLSEKSTFGLANLIVKELMRLENKDIAAPSDNKAFDYMLLDKSITPSFQDDKKSVSKSLSLNDKLSRWNHIISSASEKFNIDKNLISAVIAQESGGNQFALSRAGAKGLMQLMDSTAKELGVTQSYNPQMNIYGGVKYLRMMLDKFNGNEELALASYNAGPGAVEKFKGIPPYAETENYVKSVLQMRTRFAQDEEDSL
jgi:soluble lytic murein transglycosylase-like protein